MVKEIKSTRLRYVRGKHSDVSLFLSSLPFKVEIKAINEDKNKATVWFVIPESVAKFGNIEL